MGRIEETEAIGYKQAAASDISYSEQQQKFINWLANQESQFRECTPQLLESLTNNIATRTTQNLVSFRHSENRWVLILIFQKRNFKNRGMFSQLLSCIRPVYFFRK